MTPAAATAATRPDAGEDPRTAEQRGEEDSRRRRRERLPVDPGRAGGGEERWRPPTTSRRMRAPSTTAAGRHRRHRRLRGERRGQRGRASATERQDRCGSRLSARSPRSGADREAGAGCPVRLRLRSSSSPRSRKSRAGPIAGSARTTVNSATAAARTMPVLHVEHRAEHGCSREPGETTDADHAGEGGGCSRYRERPADSGSGASRSERAARRR